jgi:DNA polymerase-3 subunit gamma/tau
LIKLCYLAQALQVAEEGGGGKKKQPDAVRPVSFRNIPAMEPVRRPAPERAPVETGKEGRQGGGAKLLVESDISEPQRTRTTAPAARAVPATPANSPEPATEKKVPGTVGASTASLGSLSRIRQQFSTRSSGEEATNIRPLEAEALNQAWRQYADQLRENRNPAVQSLELATLRIIDKATFEVVTGNNLEQKFIEQEKRNLSDHLQKIFANKAISFTVIIEEKEDSGEEPVDRPLNKREQFLQIVEQYPLVKELKDRLRLELDY